jgi:acetylornithine deacetylase/succinyl-diaminopimelate desuccinylase-like protein
VLETQPPSEPDVGLLQSAFELVEEDEVCQLALDLCAIPSPTGEEAAVAEFICDWFAAEGLEPTRQVVEEGRQNAVGVLRGRGAGPALMFNGHVDTVEPMSHEQVLGIVPEAAAVFTPYVEDRTLFGEGMGNMKSAIAAFMSAAQALRRAGLMLRGDLILACVAGETTGASVDQYQSRHFRSKGVGTRYLLTHGVVSDFAIVADTSHFGVSWAECGVVFAKITTAGVPLYTPFTGPGAGLHSDTNPIAKMLPILEAIDAWATDYECRSIYRFAGGEVHPKVSIGAIAGGVPFRPGISPPTCSVYLDIRTPPNGLPLDVQRELRGVLDATGVEHRCDFYLSQRGYEGEGVGGLVGACRWAYQVAAGEPIPPIEPVETSMWTDTNLYHEAGIPAVKFGIGGPHTGNGSYSAAEFLHRQINATAVDDLMKATKMYMAVAAMICGAT